MVQNVQKQLLNGRLLVTVTSTNAIIGVIEAACDKDLDLAYLEKRATEDKPYEFISYGDKTYVSSFFRCSPFPSCYTYTVEFKESPCTI